MVIIDFKETVAVLTSETFTKKSYTTGTIKELLIDYPDGANNLVNVKVFLGSKILGARDGSIALNDRTLQINLNEEVRAGDWVIVKIENGDDVNSHEIFVSLIVEEKKGGR